MAKSWILWMIGDLEEKRAYRRFMKRVNALPDEYRYAFKKMRNYLYNTDLTGCETVFADLVELLEASAAEGKPVLAVIGGDVAAFCDELVRASAPSAHTSRETLNQEILEHFHRKGE